MYCPNCDLRVETEFARHKKKEEAQRYKKWFDEDEVHGGYSLDEVGSTESGPEKDWTVCIRIDICVNCGVPIRARTYLQHFR